MTGWVLFAVLAVGAGAALVLLGVPRRLWMLVASALTLAAAGYAWQGEPGLPAHPVAADAVRLPPPASYKALRDTFYGRFGGESVYFGVSDAALSAGNTWVAVRVLTGGVDYAPGNIALWSELGNAIALHDQGLVSPAALLAYRRAIAIAPDHPGPPFFLAMAYVRAGQFAQARPWLARSLRLAPAGASYRGEIARRLVLLDAYLAAARRQPAG